MIKTEIKFPVNDSHRPSSGMFSGMTDMDDTRTLERQDILTGIVESLDERGDEFGYGHLEQVIEDLTDNNASISKRGVKKVARELLHNGDIGNGGDFSTFRLASSVKHDDTF